MSSVLDRPFRIVAAVGDTPMDHIIVERALDIAARYAHPELHFIRVVEVSPRLFRHAHPGQVEAAHAELESLVAVKLDDFGISGASDHGPRLHLHARGGDPADEITSLAEDISADLIVVGRHGGMEGPRSRIGSVPHIVLIEAHCPVFVVQPVDYDVDQGETCDECVRVRDESEGDVWFCDAHAGDRDFKTTSLIADAYIPLRGGPLV